MRTLFRETADQQSFDQGGYVVSDFLGEDEIGALRDLYFTTAGRGHQTYDFASKLSYYISIFDKDPRHRRLANDGIRKVFEKAVDRLMVDYRILYCNFMVKAPQGGEIQAHQDFTWVDEQEHLAFNLWVPLQDTHDRNGCFHLVSGTNKLLSSYRSATAPDSLTAYNEPLKEFMQPLPLAGGRGITFEHKLFHFSPDNHTDEPRVAAQLVLIPKEAQAVIAHYDASAPDRVSLLAIHDEEYLVERNLWEAPEQLPVFATRPYEKLPPRDDLMAMVRRHTAQGARAPETES